MDVSGEIVKMRTLWSEWELRALVLSSLFIQIILISTAGMRTHTRYRMIVILIWLCYLFADWVATFALGVLAKTLINHSDSGGSQYQSGSGSNQLKECWAPFLLLHLGGPDNLTAFSLEDNELWLRHLLGFLLQVGTALYVFFNSFPGLGLQLKLITTLMFMGGIIKYVERTLALKNGSRDNLRDAMANDPDPGPDYAKYTEEYCRRRSAERQTDVSLRSDKQEQYLLPVIKAENGDEDGRKMSKIELIAKAHYLFHMIFKRLVVDLIMAMQEAHKGLSRLGRTSWEETYEVIEIEIGLLYEILYTKAGVVHHVKGWFLRFISISSITSASIIFFAFIEKQGYDRIDVTITYVLLSAAIALEFWSLTRLLFADWTVAWLVELRYNRLAEFVFKVISYKGPPNRSRWSNSMGQYNLIKFCLKDYQLPLVWGKVMTLIHVKDLFDNNWYMTNENISKNLKEFIFKDLESKLAHATDLKSHQNLRTSRGQLALLLINTDDEVLYNSINKVEFDESILLWHIATDICYYLDGNGDGEEHVDETVRAKQKISRDISNYMLYLLISRPYMLTAGIGKIRFGDTCAEAKRFIHQKGMAIFNEQHACKSLHEVDTEIPPEQVKGDKSKSVLFEAVRIAKSLLKQEIDVKMRWDVISLVWSEMLRYAANQCKGYNHAKGLANGGELLTLVCYLMAHFGVGDQYRVIQGEVPADGPKDGVPADGIPADVNIPQPTNPLESAAHDIDPPQDSRVLEGPPRRGASNFSGLIPKLESCLKFQASSCCHISDSDSDKGDSVNDCRPPPPASAADPGGVLNSPPPSVPIVVSLHGDLDPGANQVEAENVCPSVGDRDASTSSPAIVNSDDSKYGVVRSAAVHFQEATFVDLVHLQDAAGFQTVEEKKDGRLQGGVHLGDGLACLSIKVEDE